MQPDLERLVLLLVPAAMLLLGMLLLICARLLRRQEFLYWCALGHVLPGLGLVMQSGLTDIQMVDWSVPVGLLYMGGAIAMAQGIALRFGGAIVAQMALGITVQTVVGLLCCSWFIDDALARMFMLNAALGMLHALALPPIIRNWRHLQVWDWVVGISYAGCVGFALLRTFWLVVTSADDAALANAQQDWELLLVAALLFTLWFAFSLIIGSVIDVLETMRSERDSDPLTGLINRRAFHEQAELSLKAAQAQRWFVVSCDVDHFKAINDRWGHETGDMVLRQVADVLGQGTRRALRSGGAAGGGMSLSGLRRVAPRALMDGLAARFGGEEFILLMPCVDAAEAVLRTEALRLGMGGVEAGPLEQPPSASFGLTELHGIEDLDRALGRADQLLYQAKARGRDRVVIDPALREDAASVLPPAPPPQPLGHEVRGSRVIDMQALRQELRNAPRPGSDKVA